MSGKPLSQTIQALTQESFRSDASKRQHVHRRLADTFGVRADIFTNSQGKTVLSPIELVK
jgi:hypothetical protein